MSDPKLWFMIIAIFVGILVCDTVMRLVMGEAPTFGRTLLGFVIGVAVGMVTIAMLMNLLEGFVMGASRSFVEDWSR
jgi:hypothetical protein